MPSGTVVVNIGQLRLENSGQRVPYAGKERADRIPDSPVPDFLEGVLDAFPGVNKELYEGRISVFRMPSRSVVINAGQLRLKDSGNRIPYAGEEGPDGTPDSPALDFLKRFLNAFPRIEEELYDRRITEDFMPPGTVVVNIGDLWGENLRYLVPDPGEELRNSASGPPCLNVFERLSNPVLNTVKELNNRRICFKSAVVYGRCEPFCDRIPDSLEESGNGVFIAVPPFNNRVKTRFDTVSKTDKPVGDSAETVIFEEPADAFPNLRPQIPDHLSDLTKHAAPAKAGQFAPQLTEPVAKSSEHLAEILHVVELYPFSELAEQIDDRLNQRLDSFFQDAEHILYDFPDHFQYAEYARKSVADLAEPAVGIIHIPKPAFEPVNELPETFRDLLQFLACQVPEHFGPGAAEGSAKALCRIDNAVDPIDEIFTSVIGVLKPDPCLRLLIPGFSAPLPEHVIPVFADAVHYTADLVVDRAPEGRGFRHVTENKFHGIRPAALYRFSQGIPHFAEGADLRGSLHSRPADFLQLLHQLFVMNIESPGSQRVEVEPLVRVKLHHVQHGVLVQPSLLQGIAEVLGGNLQPVVPCQFLAVLVDGDEELVDFFSVDGLDFFLKFSGGRGAHDEHVLQFRRRDVGSLNGLPVKRGHLADTQSLREVVHRHAGLLRALASLRRHVGDTLHGSYGSFQVNVLVGELTDVGRHV